MNIQGAWGACKIGRSINQPFVAFTPITKRLVTTGAFPILFCLRATQSVHVAQGGPDIEATETSRLLRGGNYYDLFVENFDEAYLSCYGLGTGTLYITNLSYLGVY